MTEKEKQHFIHVMFCDWCAVSFIVGVNHNALDRHAVRSLWERNINREDFDSKFEYMKESYEDQFACFDANKKDIKTTVEEVLVYCQKHLDMTIEAQAA